MHWGRATTASASARWIGLDRIRRGNGVLVALSVVMFATAACSSPRSEPSPASTITSTLPSGPSSVAPISSVPTPSAPRPITSRARASSATTSYATTSYATTSYATTSYATTSYATTSIATTISARTTGAVTSAGAATFESSWKPTVDGLLTFRGNPNRRFYGVGPVPNAPAVAWTYPKNGGMCRSSSAKGETKTWCGAGWTGQPTVHVREGRTWLVFNGYDGAVHFVDAENGE